jgi:hypothetical protein
MKKTIILDTNFLMIPSQFGLDIFLELSKIVDFSYTLCIIDKTIDELEKIKQEGGKKDRSSAKVGLELIERYRIQKLESGEMSVDDAIVRISKSDEHIVCTIDKELQARLKEKKVQIVVIRKKQHLSFQ